MRVDGMRRAFVWVSRALLMCGFVVLAVELGAQTPAGVQGDASDTKNVPIYLSDFELSSVREERGSRNAPVANPGKDTGELVYAETDPAPVKARRMIDAFANTLLKQFDKNGYTASRVSGSPPAKGVLLRGVFAEPDKMNRIRRAILGAGAPGPTFTLYVGAFNLARPAQPLYQQAPVQARDARYGPVITLNAYVPMVKFEVPKNPSAEDVQKVCREIVSELATLLVTNPNAISK